VIHFYLPDQLVAEVCDGAPAPEWIDPMKGEDRIVAEIARATARVLRLGGPVGRLRAQAAMLQLAARLLEAHGASPPVPVADAHGGLPPARLRAVLERMGDDLQDEPSLLDLAQLARISPKHFARAFKQSTGLTAHGWLMRRRLSRAQGMLTGSAEPIAEVAVACGFADQSHFTAAFRKALGVTPAAYRRSRLC
jgi:AraC family transcriptional regulator